MSYISNLDPVEIDNLREHLTKDFRAFSQFAFKILTGTKLIDVDYYNVLFEAIEDLIEQRTTRMIINIPPRAGKTLIVSQLLPLFAWVHAPSAQTILTGFNSDVLAESSGYIRSIMQDPDFQRVFPDVQIDPNKKSNEKLGTMAAGVLHAIPTTGKLTGKGAGALVDGFAGILNIDDVIKPDDANSPTEREKINNRFGNTILSRLATETTPLVIIMQRLHNDDLCGYLMRGGTDDTYVWLNIPGLIRKETGSQKWYDEQIEEFGYTHVVPYLYDLKRDPDEYDSEGDSSFWKIRKTVDTLKGMRAKDPYTFYSQYMGKPIGKGKAALDRSSLNYYNDISEFKIAYTFMTADTASTTKSYSSYTVACHWGVEVKRVPIITPKGTKFEQRNRLILIDMIRDKWEIPKLTIAIREFWKEKNVFDPNAPGMKPRAFYMEDKASGLFLNQQFLSDGTVNVRPVPRDGTNNNDKFTRFLPSIPYFESGQILIPRAHEHTDAIRLELLGMTEFGNSTGNDDIVDNFSDATAIAYSGSQVGYADWA